MQKTVALAAVVCRLLLPHVIHYHCARNLTFTTIQLVQHQDSPTTVTMAPFGKKASKGFKGKACNSKENNINLEGLFPTTTSTGAKPQPRTPLASIEPNKVRDKVLPSGEIEALKSEAPNFDLINTQEFGNWLCKNLCCGGCKEKTLEYGTRDRTGLAFTFQLFCTNCSFYKELSNSEPKQYQLQGIILVVYLLFFTDTN